MIVINWALYKAKVIKNNNVTIYSSLISVSV